MNLLGIDFEDWYHPELIQQYVRTKKDPTVINGIDKIVDILRKNDTYATFFVVGELLEHRPELLDKILSNGHEVGFHTMHHTRIDSLNPDTFTEELRTFDRMTRGKSKGFRAPTFSINQRSGWAMDILADYGYTYDSSIVPAKTSMYGFSDAEERPYRISSTSLTKNDPKSKIMEFPIMTTKILGKKIPAGGGFYLRLLPLNMIKDAIRNCEHRSIPSTFYIHSWEITPELMPRLYLPIKNRFITYYNLTKAKLRLEKILMEFKFTSFERYIKSSNSS